MLPRTVSAFFTTTMLGISVFGCAYPAQLSQHHAQARGPYRRDIPFGREEAITRLIRSLATTGFQFSVDRASGIITTVPDILMIPGTFDCDLLLRGGQPAYTITGVAGRLQFVVDGDDLRSTVRASAILGRAFFVRPTGSQGAAMERCFSSHRLEEAIVNGAVDPQEHERLSR
jgi:hypothetical protein